MCVYSKAHLIEGRLGTGFLSDSFCTRINVCEALAGLKELIIVCFIDLLPQRHVQGDSGLDCLHCCNTWRARLRRGGPSCQTGHHSLPQRAYSDRELAYFGAISGCTELPLEKTKTPEVWQRLSQLCKKKYGSTAASKPDVDRGRERIGRLVLCEGSAFLPVLALCLPESDMKKLGSSIVARQGPCQGRCSEAADNISQDWAPGCSDDFCSGLSSALYSLQQVEGEHLFTAQGWFDF